MNLCPEVCLRDKRESVFSWACLHFVFILFPANFHSSVNLSSKHGEVMTFRTHACTHTHTHSCCYGCKSFCQLTFFVLMQADVCPGFSTLKCFLWFCVKLIYTFIPFLSFVNLCFPSVYSTAVTGYRVQSPWTPHWIPCFPTAPESLQVLSETRM